MADAELTTTENWGLRYGLVAVVTLGLTDRVDHRSNRPPKTQVEHSVGCKCKTCVGVYGSGGKRPPVA